MDEVTAAKLKTRIHREWAKIRDEVIKFISEKHRQEEEDLQCCLSEENFSKFCSMIEKTGKIDDLVNSVDEDVDSFGYD